METSFWPKKLSRYLKGTVRTYKGQLVFFEENFYPLYVRKTLAIEQETLLGKYLGRFKNYFMV